ncbi:MAG: acyl carrier protein [Alcanivoracaceae bacterium]|jgi:acyl carrier protein|nr:acyl carrier protein [Alcanivoracaceae bacterium]
MSQRTETICQVVEQALKQAAQTDTLSAPVTADSQMNSPREWDSLAFVSVFLAVSQHFGIEVEEDDAIHFTSIAGINEFLDEAL